ncbi:hypothetical protein TrVFT333_002044 [Trichoderma virens FT-333]|nr:hypothetical protein TrVFT333_002044 [Trichoderma virens FT-333]
MPLIPDLLSHPSNTPPTKGPNGTASTSLFARALIIALFGAIQSRAIESLRFVGFGTSIGDLHQAGGVGLELRGLTQAGD